MEQVKKFVVGFFESLKCGIRWDNDVLVVENVPKGFEDFAGKVAPYRLSFDKEKDGEFVGKGGVMLDFILKFLKKGGKTSILKIDFSPKRDDSGEPDCDAEAEIRKRMSFNNCELQSLGKSYRNNFFARFSFVVNFNYLNESERVVEEIYVHEGKVVSGDLDGYTTLDDRGLKMDDRVKGMVKSGYGVAVGELQEILKVKTEEVAGILSGKIEGEIERIVKHYDRQISELGGDLNGKLERVRELELGLRASEGEEREILRRRLENAKRGLLKVGDDEVMQKVEREKELTIQDLKQKFSLNVDKKLVNTTVIYYPVYAFKLCLGAGSNKKLVELSYDPLTGVLGGLECEGCGNEIRSLNLCEGGHISCGECLDSCGECGKKFCVKCLKRSCVGCGRKLCRNCVKMCLGCGKYACRTHMRRDCVSGEERCVSCLRACLRCHGMASEKFFGESRDGSKVCQKCLGAEKRGEVLKGVFES
ncbi:hypothetical protein HNV12_01110 [Methanococcoides sp. SA1]|nr:hypothetical protein [Methanococcoides sp. SA1]